MKVPTLLLAVALCVVATAPGAVVAVDSPGSVPADESAPGAPLTMGKGAGGSLNLFWSPSCTGLATNYAVYQGTLPINGNYTHAALNCALGNTTTANISPGAGSRYYLVVPTTATNEGLYGVSTIGGDHLIPAAASTCLPQIVASCPVFECLGEDPSIGHCTTDLDCGLGFCDHIGCTPGGCVCASSATSALDITVPGAWICSSECVGHCVY